MLIIISLSVMSMQTTDSNAKRLAALKNKKKQQTQQALAIQKCLKDVAASTNKVTKFSDSEPEEEENKITDILQDVESEGEEVIFSDKAHFLGKRGEKLMTLQSKIGGDDRFKLDTRFEDSGSGSEDGSEGDEEVRELREERGKQYNLMDSILDQLGLNTRKPHPSTNKTCDAFVRYDPTDETHTKYVVDRTEKTTEDNIGVANENSEEIETEGNRESEAPVVDKNTYFEVKTDFANTAPAETPVSGFKFGFSFDPEPAEKVGEAELVKIPELQHDSSDEEETMDMQSSSSVVKSPATRSFFFYTQNPVFKDISSCNFVRTKTLEEIETQLVTERAQLTQGYRKRHKDAIRSQRKLSTK